MEVQLGKSSLIQKVSLGYGILLFSQVVNFVGGIVVARIVGPTVLGQLAFAMSFVGMLGFVAELGLGVAHTKLISEGVDIRRAVGTYLRLKVVLVCLFLLMIGCIAWVQSNRGDPTFHDPVLVVIVFVFTLSTLFGQLAQVPVATFAGRTEQAKKDLPLAGQVVLTQILRVSVAAIGFGAIALALCQFFGTIMFVAALFYLVKPYLGGGFDTGLAKRYYLMAIPLLILFIAQTIADNVDRVILQYRSSTIEVGYYAVALSLVGFVKTFGQSAGNLLFPVFSAADSAGDLARIDRIIEKYENAVFAFLVPLAGFIAAASPVLVRLLLGQKFSPATPVVSIIVFGTILFVVNLPYGNLIAGKGKFHLLSIVATVNVMVIGLGGWCLVSPNLGNLGAVGMAWAFVFASLCGGYLHRVIATKLLGHGQWPRHVRLVLPAAALCAALFAARSLLDFAQLKTAGVFVFLAFSVVLILGYEVASGFHKSEEWQLMKRALDPVSMAKYIREEMQW
jgi:O-antigen/teichoic acid export membrane protein